MNTDALYATHWTLIVLLPEVLMLLAAIAMMTAGAFVSWSRAVWAWLTAGTFGAAFIALIAVQSFSGDTSPFCVPALSDDFAIFGSVLLIVTGLIITALAHDQVSDDRAAEFFGAILMVHAGGMLVAAANELVFLFVGLELVSIPTYLLLYLARRSPATREAATKYFYLSIFSASLLLFGLAYLYGMTGVGNFKALDYLAHAAPQLFSRWFVLIAVVFVMAGLGFRVAAVPFHFYAPDVYQGSPTIIAALLAWVPKAVGFFAIVRVLTSVLGGTLLSEKAIVLSWIIAVATMTLGNTVALLQENLKRLLAYSSIAHAGYLMIGTTAAFAASGDPVIEALGPQSILFYLAAYALMTLGVFGFMLALSTPERSIESIDDLQGLSRSHPLSAVGLTLCLFSLAGVPVMAGFWGKFWIFYAVLSAAPGDSALILLAVLGGINAAIGAYYYLRIVVLMWLWPPVDEPLAPRPSWPTLTAVWTCAGLSLFLGIFTGPLLSASEAGGTAAVAQPEPQGVLPPVHFAVPMHRAQP